MQILRGRGAPLVPKAVKLEGLLKGTSVVFIISFSSNLLSFRAQPSLLLVEASGRWEESQKMSCLG
jgi:hypothetical protein